MTDPLINPTSSFPEASKLADVQAAVRRSGSGRIAFAGPEGAGKSTLVRSMLATAGPQRTAKTGRDHLRAPVEEEPER